MTHTAIPPEYNVRKLGGFMVTWGSHINTPTHQHTNTFIHMKHPAHYSPPLPHANGKDRLASPASQVVTNTHTHTYGYKYIILYTYIHTHTHTHPHTTHTHRYTDT